MTALPLILLFIAGLIYAIGFGVMILEFLDAQEGYEDATGFHWGKEPSVSVQCAWCRRVMTAAPAGSPVTHTICPACSAKFFPETTHETQPAKSHV